MKPSGNGVSGSARFTLDVFGAAAVGWVTPGISTSCSSRFRVAGSICGAPWAGDVIDILVESRRNRHAAVGFFRKLLKGQGCVPRGLITDKLRSCPAARRTVLPSVVHCSDR